MTKQNKEEIKKRPIRTYILRQGRITAAQSKAIQDNFQKNAVIFENKIINFGDIFENKNNDLILEIGFGMGETTAKIAHTLPDCDFIAAEVHTPGVGALLKLIDEQSLTNIRVIQHDVVEVLHNMIADGSLDGVHIFFPDPWHKKRHHKRRLIQAEFVKLLCAKLKSGAYIHVATDWQEYAEWVLEVLNAEPLLQNTAPDYAQKPAYRPLTKFENRGIKLGHGVWDMVFTRK